LIEGADIRPQSHRPNRTAVLDKVLDTSKSVDPTTRAGHPLNSLIVQARGHIVEAQTRLGDIVKR
jgi:hypothetical protein